LATILDSSKIANANKTLAGVAGGLTGVIAFINTSTAKFVLSNFTTKAVYAASQVLGPQLTWAIIGGTGKTQVTINNVVITQSQLPAQAVNPWGALNTTTYSGIALLLADWGLSEFVGHKYGMQFASPWLFALGAALTGAGVLGGIFDPVAGRSVGLIGPGAIVPTQTYGQTVTASKGFGGIGW
jgi:hypothetical protein